MHCGSVIGHSGGAILVRPWQLFEFNSETRCRKFPGHKLDVIRMQRLQSGLRWRMSVTIAWAPFGDAIGCRLNAIGALTLAWVPFGNTPRPQIERNVGMSLAIAWARFANAPGHGRRAVREHSWTAAEWISGTHPAAARMQFGNAQAVCPWPWAACNFDASLATAWVSFGKVHCNR